MVDTARLRAAAPRSCIPCATALGAPPRSGERAGEASRLDVSVVCVITAPAPPNLAGLDADSPASILCVELVRLVDGVQDEGLLQLAELTMAGEA